jgi:hypothetical protein
MTTFICIGIIKTFTTNTTGNMMDAHAGSRVSRAVPCLENSGKGMCKPPEKRAVRFGTVSVMLLKEDRQIS